MNKKQINAALENAINKAAEAAKSSLAQAKQALTEKNANSQIGARATQY